MFLRVEFRAVSRSRTPHTRMGCGGLQGPFTGKQPTLPPSRTWRARRDIRQHSVTC